MADYEDTNISNLIINNISQEKFDELKNAGQLDPTQVYLTPEQGGGAGGDYLPLSGGTMTGGIVFDVTGDNYTDVPIIKVGPYGISAQIGGSGTPDGTLKTGNLFSSGYITATAFGTRYNPGFAYLATIANGTGGNLTVPTEGGTLARLEDLEGISGGTSLPDQTDNAGKFLMTDGATPSWGNAWSYGTIPEDTICIGSLTDTNAAGAVVISRQATSAGTYTVNIGGGNSLGPASVAIGYQAVVDLNKGKSIAIGAGARCMAKNAIQLAAVGGSYSITQTTNSDDNTFKVANNNGNFEMMDANGNVPRERLKNLVEVLPTADNGYTTVKNFGNGYVEITGYTAIGTVGASTGSEVQIDLPAGYTMADANYWVNIAPTSETTMFDFKAEAKARSTTHFMVAYKNEDATTGLTAAGVYWEVRGMLATA